MRVCLSCEHRFESAGWRCPACGWTPAMDGPWPLFAPDLAAGNDGFSAALFSVLFDSESQHFWFRARNRLLVWALGRYFPEARCLLEIGCGTGYVLSGIRAACPQLRCEGSDVFPEGLAFAGSRLPGVALAQMNAERIPFDSEFDVVGAFDVLEHIDADERVLAQMFQAATPGGGVIITVPQHPWLWSAVDECGSHKRRYTRRGLVGKLEAAGFRGIRTTSFVSLLLPVLAAQRILRIGGHDADALAELRIGRTLNATLERVMAIERALLIRGMRLPAGGSLLAVAYKPRT